MECLVETPVVLSPNIKAWLGTHLSKKELCKVELGPLSWRLWFLGSHLGFAVGLWTDPKLWVVICPSVKWRDFTKQSFLSCQGLPFYESKRDNVPFSRGISHCYSYFPLASKNTANFSPPPPLIVCILRSFLSFAMPYDILIWNLKSFWKYTSGLFVSLS